MELYELTVHELREKLAKKEITALTKEVTIAKPGRDTFNETVNPAITYNATIATTIFKIIMPINSIYKHHLFLITNHKNCTIKKVLALDIYLKISTKVTNF